MLFPIPEGHGILPEYGRMRRIGKEIQSPGAIAAILDEAQVCRIGLCDGAGPSGMPVCFGCEPGSTYLHSHPEGKKMEITRKIPVSVVRSTAVLSLLLQVLPVPGG